MKRKLVKLVVFVFIISILGSCTNCKECRYVTKSKGVVIEEGPWANYCDEELTKIESEAPVVTGTQTTEWECTY